MNIEHYLRRRRLWETAFWITLLAVSALANTGIAWSDLMRRGTAFHPWEPSIWEITSAVAVGLLVPVMLKFDRLFPIRADNWRRSLTAHALLTVIYSLLHVSLMYWMRVGVYKLVGIEAGYYWPRWWTEFAYEYLKDFRSYCLFLTIIYLYRFVIRRLRGEAEFLSEGHEKAAPVKAPDRFLVKKLSREFLVRVKNINWIEASGNYVNLHVASSVYPLRETMTSISDRLSAQGFQRVHRSAIVNLAHVAEISWFETGDGEVRLDTDQRIPVSRRYRRELRDRLS